MRCIQCGRSPEQCIVLRYIQSNSDFSSYKSPNTAELFLCRDCAICTKCGSYSRDRPSMCLKYSDKVQIKTISKPWGWNQRIQVDICISLPWECLKCEQCAICKAYSRNMSDNFHKSCFTVWCIRRFRESILSIFPKDIVRIILYHANH